MVIINYSLCAGSILLFSLWAPVFQQKLGYSQMQINAISIAGELGMYLPWVYPLSSRPTWLFADMEYVIVFRCLVISVTRWGRED